MDTERLRATIASAQAGAAEGYEALLEAYGPRLYGFFYRATGRHHEAEDLLGDLTLRLVRKLPRYTHDGRFDQWLFRIAANMLRDRIRRRKVRPSSIPLQGTDDEKGGAPGDRLSGPAEPVDAALLAAEMSVELDAALAQLDETTRHMIVLRHFGEMSFKDIAEIFGCPLGTALAKVHRGLRTLRQILEHTK